MDKLFFTAYSAAKGRVLRGDFTDRLHSNYTVTCLLAILLILVSKQYSEGAIACWLPKQFTGDQVNSTQHTCSSLSFILLFFCTFPVFVFFFLMNLSKVFITCLGKLHPSILLDK